MTHEKHYTVRQVAEILQVTRQHVYAEIRRRRMSCIHIGGTKRITESQLADYQQTNTIHREQSTWPSLENYQAGDTRSPLRMPDEVSRDLDELLTPPSNAATSKSGSGNKLIRDYSVLSDDIYSGKH